MINTENVDTMKTAGNTDNLHKMIKIIGITSLAVIVSLIGLVIFLLVSRNSNVERDALTAEELQRLWEMTLQGQSGIAGDQQQLLEMLTRQQALLDLLNRQAADPNNQELQRLIQQMLLNQQTGAPNNQELQRLIEQMLRNQQGALAANAHPYGDESPELAAQRQAEAQRQSEERRQAEEQRLQREEELRIQRENEAARQKAQEEEMARASREMQERMRAVNDLISQGRALLERGDTAGAERAFAEARSRMPSGNNRFEAQKLAEMAEAWYELSSLHPDTPAGITAAQKAAALAEESIAIDNTLSLPHYTMGKINRDRRNWNRAINDFEEATRLDTSNYVYFFELGRSYFAAQRYPNARNAFESTVKLNPRFESGWYNLGGVLRFLNRNDEALAAYRQAISLKADYALAHREVGRILFARKDYKGAVESFNNAIKYNPNDLASLRELGTAHSESGNYTAAENAFARVLQSAPADAQTNYNMAIVKLALKKNNEAFSFAKSAFDNSSSNAVYAYTLGLTCEALGDPVSAVAVYRTAASLDAHYLRPRINLGSIYISQNKYDDAIAILREAFIIAPSNFEVNNNLGAVNAKMEQWSTSIEHYERALAAEANHPTVHMNLARAYTSAGNLVKAQNSYQAVLRLEPNNWDALFELGKTCVSMEMPEEAKKYLNDLLHRNASYSGKAEAERILAEI